jgi:hypothetical protein
MSAYLGLCVLAVLVGLTEVQILWIMWVLRKTELRHRQNAEAARREAVKLRGGF